LPGFPLYFLKAARHLPDTLWWSSALNSLQLHNWPRARLVFCNRRWLELNTVIKDLTFFGTFFFTKPRHNFWGLFLIFCPDNLFSSVWIYLVSSSEFL
jgi:hypothetical protein